MSTCRQLNLAIFLWDADLFPFTPGVGTRDDSAAEAWYLDANIQDKFGVEILKEFQNSGRNMSEGYVKLNGDLIELTNAVAASDAFCRHFSKLNFREYAMRE